MRLKIKAKLSKVDEVIHKDKFSRQRILLEIPIYDSFSGDLLRTEHFPAAILNKNIEKCDAPAKLDKLVNAVCFLSSFQKSKDEVVYYNLSLNCVELELLQP